ncbi:MAG: IPT/TIG domain-containing protein, partial [Terriglobia bacterium]
TAQITVFNPAPGGGASNALTFTINNPMPSISGLVPDQIPAGSADFTLRVQGTGFRGGVSEVRWNGSPRPTTINVSGELEVTVAAADVAALGTATVAVFNPGPGGGLSNAVPFTISLRNPLPTVTGLEPPGAVAGGGNFMLTVTGSNFVFNSEVQWNGSPQPTIWKNKQKLEATISAADILGPGPTTATVAVVNPAPGGGTSNPATFFITAAPNPLPVISSISPASAPVSRSGLALTVNGTAFQANSVVRLDGAPRPTTFASASQLQAALLPDDLTTAATRLVTVFTPVPGGGTSNDIAFTATNPLPTLSALSPANLPGGSSGFALTVTGTNFVPGSMVQWDGAALATSFVGPTTLRATVPAGNVATTGMVDVTVETPTPGGGTSAAQGFTITAGGNPPPALTSLMPSSAPAGRNGFLLTVDGSDFVHGSVVRWNGADRLTTFLSSTQLLAVISDADVAAAIPVDVTVFTPPPGGGLSMTSLPFTLLALPGPAPPAGHAPLGRARSEANTGTRVGTVEGATARSGATAVLGGETGRADEAKSKDRASSDPAGALREAPGQAEPLFRTVVAEAPVIESVSPEEIKAGSGEVTLIVRGRGFREDSVARLNGRELETTYVSPFRLEATLTRADLPKPGAAQLTVFNPADGKESAPQRLLVAPAH